MRPQLRLTCPAARPAVLASSAHISIRYKYNQAAMGALLRAKSYYTARRELTKPQRACRVWAIEYCAGGMNGGTQIFRIWRAMPGPGLALIFRPGRAAGYNAAETVSTVCGLRL